MTNNLPAVKISTIITFTLLLFLAINSSIKAQVYEDDPNLDQIPQWYLDQTKSFSKVPSTVVTVNDYDNYFLGVDFAECHIAVNPNVPTEFFSVFNIDNSHRTNNGHDWSNSTVSWGTVIRGDVIVAYDSLGNLYYENMYGSSSILGCKVAVSQNNGQTFTPAVTAINGVDKNWMAADQTGGPYSNNVYTVMTSNGGGNFARSTNQGTSWTNTATFNTQSLPGMMVCVGPNGDIQGGSVYVVTNGGNSFASNYTFYRSQDGGSSFQQMSSQYFAGYVGINSNGRHSVENMRTRPYPFIGADNSYGPHRGRLYLIYASNDPPGNGNKPDIWCRYSDNGGSTWSSDIKVNDDESTANNHQFAPAMWCDYKTGNLYVQWMDTRDTPTSDSAMIYGTYSDDGGETFYPNVAVSNEKMKINCTTCGASGNPRYQGDYNGIVSNPKVAMAVWTDFRNGSFGSYVGYLPDFAMRVYPSELEIAYQDTIWAIVPDVKLYNDTVIFTASIDPPSSGDFIISFPEGNMLTTYPDSIPVVVVADDVPTGEYQITVTGTGPNGTPVHHREATLIPVDLPMPVVDFAVSETELCYGSSVDFTDATLNFPTQWFWTFEGGSPASSTEQNPTGISYAIPGTYDVTLYAVNATGFDEITKTDYIFVGPAMSFDPLDDICQFSDPLVLTTGTPSAGTYFGTAVENGMFDPEIAGQGTHIIGFTYTDENLCTDTLYQEINVLPAPVINLGPDTTLCPDQAILLDLTDPDIQEFLWSPGNQTTSFITVDSAGIGIGSQLIGVMATGFNGCTASDEIVISFEECSGIGEIDGIQKLDIYPNPNQGVFNLQISTVKPLVISYKLYSSDGTLISKENDIGLNNAFEKTIVMPHAEKGIYYLVLSTGKQELMRKIVVK
ncbi:MAG: T9SS type A sorting domain-containing protein [Bacteroidales bacterium]|nr:T9SS type A sorting domain-containing protein [Bacteroidales bacterium]